MNSLVPLHVHDQFSILDGFGTIEDYVKRIKEIGSPSLALTNHGNLNGTAQQFFTCKKESLKPIFGMEAYLAPNRLEKTKDRFHLTILARNKEGWENLLKINNDAHRKGFYYKPRTDTNFILDNSGGLIILSGCVSSYLARSILGGNYQQAKKFAETYRQHLKDNFFLEFQLLPLQESTIVNQGIKKLHEETGIPLVYTSDAHYPNKEDSSIHDLLIAINTKSKLGGSLEFEHKEYYIKSIDEVLRDHKKHNIFTKNQVLSAIDNTYRIYEQVEEFDISTQYPLPTLKFKKGSAEEFIKKICLNRLKTLNKNNQEYLDRLDYELKIITQLSFCEYLIIVWDFVKYAKDNDIAVGVGRGSSASSLVCYLLEITSIDPVIHSLIFERFINPHKHGYPDIDVDFESTRREEVKQYIINKYGEDRVADIGVYGYFRFKSLIKDISRVFELEFDKINKITRSISHKVADELKILSKDKQDRLIDSILDSADISELESKYPNIRNTLKKLQGQVRHSSIHAAGVLITGKDLDSQVPLHRQSGKLVTGWSEGGIEAAIDKLGFIKYDILGINTLSILKESCRLANIKYKDIDISFSDEKVFELAGKGMTVGVFQFEPSYATSILEKIKPKNLSDMAIATAINRPGSIDSGGTNLFLERRENPGTITYKHPIIEEVLKDTLGIFIFQEQLLVIANRLAGMPLEEVDILQKALGKGKTSKELRKSLKGSERRFLQGCIAHGLNKVDGEELWNNMKTFVRYGFNKAHAFSYAALSYMTLWMKVYYPLEFYCANLSLRSSEEISIIINEASKFNIGFEFPDINKSEHNFVPHNSKILWGLSNIKFLGKNAIEEIMSKRPFSSIEDFEDRIEKKKCNSRTKLYLLYSGALNSLASEKELEDYVTKLNGTLNKKNQSEALGFNVRKLDLNNHSAIIDKYEKETKKYKVCVGLIDNIEERKTRGRKPFKTIHLTTINNNVKFNVWSDKLIPFKDVLIDQNIVLVKLKKDTYKGKTVYSLDNIKEIS